jgi:hypothetical protein
MLTLIIIIIIANCIWVCHPVAVVILHVHKSEIGLLLNLGRKSCMRSM